MGENPTLKALPDGFPNEEMIRLLHGAAWNYSKAHTDIHKALELVSARLPITLNDQNMQII
jgi:hypothetical protein